MKYIATIQVFYNTKQDSSPYEQEVMLQKGVKELLYDIDPKATMSIKVIGRW